MTDRNTFKNMVATKNKVLSCSTPEHQAESPSRDSDSEAASPVPFLCTQDGADGETDVVWNYYTPKAEHAVNTRFKNTTPLSRKAKRSKPKLIEKSLPKRRTIKKKKATELFKELVELNQNLHELIGKKSEKQLSGSEDDILNDSLEYSPKSGLRTNSRCLRKNLLSSKFCKPETETALESDDSMNECLLKASQVVEESILKYESTPAKRICLETNISKNLRPPFNIKMDQDSMGAILDSIRLTSPTVTRVKKSDSPRLCNDSFDSFVGNLNDSALERLTQVSVKNGTTDRGSEQCNKDMSWSVKELVVHDGSPPKTVFNRHNSMPESPSVADINKPSTSGMVFGRFKSMPNSDADKNGGKVPGDSPIRCTPEEIKRKHQQAREKLLAKRLLPFTSTQQTSQSTLCTQLTQSTTVATSNKNTKFQPRVASSTIKKLHHNPVNAAECQIQRKNNAISKSSTDSGSMDLKMIIEKKRQEALMKLRRRQPNKTS